MVEGLWDMVACGGGAYAKFRRFHSQQKSTTSAGGRNPKGASTSDKIFDIVGLRSGWFETQIVAPISGMREGWQL